MVTVLYFWNGLTNCWNFLSEPVWDSYEIVLGGDVNSDFDKTDDNKQSVRELKNVLRRFNQKCFEPTRYLGCLDNICTNIDITPNEFKVIMFPDSDHRAISVIYGQNYGSSDY